MSKELNNTISPKKLFAMLSVELFSMTSLILPSILVGFAGRNGLPVLLTASGLMFLQVWWYVNCLGEKNIAIDQIVEEEVKNPFRWWIKVGYSLRFFFHGLFLAVLFTALIGEILLPGMSPFFLLLPALVLIYLAAKKQLHVRGRILEVLFPYIFLPVLIVLLLALFQLEGSSLWEQLFGGLGNHLLGWNGLGQDARKEISSFWYGVYGILLFYQPVEFLLFLYPGTGEEHSSCHLADQKKEKNWVVAAACLFAVVLNTLMYVVSIGLFGTVRTGEKLWSALSIMQSIRLPGKFVERLDILFLIFWIFGTLALLSGYLYYGKRFFVQEKEEGERSQKQARWYALFWFAGIGLGTLWIREPETLFHFFIPYKMWIDFPLSILLPTFLYRKDKKSKKGMLVLFSFVGILCLIGCQKRIDLEEKDYVMTLGVEEGTTKQWRFSYEIAKLSEESQEGKSHGAKIRVVEADSFGEAEKILQNSSDKVIDYGHLKAIVFSKSWTEDQKARELIGKEWKSNTSIAGTTLLFFSEDAMEELWKAGEKQASSFGEYMENWVANHKNQLGKEDTLARFLKDESEGKKERKIFQVYREGEDIFLREEVLLAPLTSLGRTVLRFHIRANSDKKEDQEKKLAVKERILPKLQRLLANCGSKEEAIKIVERKLGQIKDWVSEACKQEGIPIISKVSLCRESFPLKCYGGMVFPSGTYDALRIDLGKGEGANWWCMMYPSLCLGDGAIEGVTEEGQKELEEQLEEEDYEALFGEQKHHFHFKWKVGEWLGSLFSPKSS